MSPEGNKRITIRNIEIRNYKGIDYLNMNFPSPRLANDPDIFVIGSRNGLGKTSILECCALLSLDRLFSRRDECHCGMGVR